MTLDRYPRWLRALVVAALAAAVLTVYAAGDWRKGDVALFHIYAIGFWGNLSHPLLPTEYPPLSVLPFSLTLLGPAASYPDVFAFWMGVIAVLGYVAFRRLSSQRQATAYALYVVAAGVATLLFRFDLAPALITVGAVWLMQRGRFSMVYALLAVATLMKLFPLALLPVAAIAHWHSRRGDPGSRWTHVAQGVGSYTAIVAAGFAAASLVDPVHGLSWLAYDLRRPVEVESVPATVLWVGSIFGAAASPEIGFGSFNLVSDLSPAINALADAALLYGLIGVYWGQLRGRFSVGQAAVAALLVLLCTSKVLSAQYLIWVAPLLALTVGFQLRWFIVCLLTALVFPVLWPVVVGQGAVVTYSTMFLVGVAVRNAALVFLTVRFLSVPGIDLGRESRGQRTAPARARTQVA
jgi:hypothetical protein